MASLEASEEQRNIQEDVSPIQQATSSTTKHKYMKQKETMLGMNSALWWPKIKKNLVLLFNVPPLEERKCNRKCNLMSYCFRGKKKEFTITCVASLRCLLHLRM